MFLRRWGELWRSTPATTPRRRLTSPRRRHSQGKQMRKEKEKGEKGKEKVRPSPLTSPWPPHLYLPHPLRNPTTKTAAASPSQQRRSSLPPSQQCRRSSLPPRMPLLPSAGAPLHIDCSRSRPVQQWTPVSPPAAQMEHRSRSPFKSSHLPSFLGARSRRRRCRRGWGRRRSSPASSGNLLAPPFISRSLLPLALPLF